MELDDLRKIVICIKGAGDLASGVAVRLKKSGFSNICMIEVGKPLAVRRTVSFCEAVYDGQITVEGVRCIKISEASELQVVWTHGDIGVIVDPEWKILKNLCPDVLVDAIIAKKNLGTAMSDAPLCIGLGPGFTAGVDVDRAIETMRGLDLGRVLLEGSPLKNTGVPSPVNGYTNDRILRAPADGVFQSQCSIGDVVKEGSNIGSVNGVSVFAQMSGVLRGLIHPGIEVRTGCKIGDIDPRVDNVNCDSVSDKARAIGGGVLEAILSRYLYRKNGCETDSFC